MKKRQKRVPRILFDDFAVDLKISNMFGKNLVKKMNVTFDDAMKEMENFFTYQIQKKKKGGSGAVVFVIAIIFIMVAIGILSWNDVFTAFISLFETLRRFIVGV